MKFRVVAMSEHSSHPFLLGAHQPIELVSEAGKKTNHKEQALLSFLCAELMYTKNSVKQKTTIRNGLEK